MRENSDTTTVPHPDDEYQTLIIRELADAEVELTAECRSLRLLLQEAMRILHNTSRKNDRLQQRLRDMTTQLEDARHELEALRRMGRAA